MTKWNSLLIACMAFVGPSFSSSLSGQSVYEGLEIISLLSTPNHINHLTHANDKFLATTDRSGIFPSSGHEITWMTHNTPWPNSLE